MPPTSQSALGQLFRRRQAPAQAAQPGFNPATLGADGLPDLEPDTATFQTAYPNISGALGAARPNNAPTSAVQELARFRYWSSAVSEPAQAARLAALVPKPPLPGPAVPKPAPVPAPRYAGAMAAPVAPYAGPMARTEPPPPIQYSGGMASSGRAPARSPAAGALMKRYKPIGSTGTSVVSGMYAADAPGTYASLDEAKASYKKPATPPVAAAKSPEQGTSPMKKASTADQLNRLGVQLKQAQMAPVPRYAGPMAAPAYRQGDFRPYADYAGRPSASHEDADIVSEFDTPNGAPSLLAQLRQGARGVGLDARAAAFRNPGAAIGAVAGAGFNALRTAVGNIRRKKKGEPTKSVLGGALTGGLVGGGLGAGVDYVAKQAEAVDQLNRLGAHLRSPTT